MMGEQVGGQDRLFYEFCLEDRVAADHLLRRIDTVLDLSCPLKLKCCPNTPSRKIPRDIHEEARDYTRSLMGSEPYLQSARERKKIETLFGDVKRNLGLTRLRLRGLTGARDEFLLAATVQNLRRLARLTGIPPPRPITA